MAGLIEKHIEVINKVKDIDNVTDYLEVIYNDDYMKAFYNYHSIKIKDQDRDDLWHDIMLTIGKVSEDKFNEIKAKNKLVEYACGVIINMLFLSGTLRNRQKYIISGLPIINS